REAVGRLHARPRGGTRPRLRGVPPDRALPDRARPLPLRAARVLLRGLARSLPPRGDGALDDLRPPAGVDGPGLLRRPPAPLRGRWRGASVGLSLLGWPGGAPAAPAAPPPPAPPPPCLSKHLRPTSVVVALGVLGAVAVNEKTGLFKIRSAPAKGLYRHMA